MAGETVSGRQPIAIVEIDQDFCVNTYGVAPCTAALGVTGTQKCFNTCASCQDLENYSLGDASPPEEGHLTIRFSEPAENLPRDVVLLPYIVDLTSQPTELNIGGSDQNASPLGTRASITVTFSDHPHHDRGLDPYVAERNYNPMELGTFWSKWLRRNPYYQGRELRVKSGYVGQALDDMRVRHYIIERIEGPSEGVVKVTAKDPIKLLEFARSQVPALTNAQLATVVLAAGEEITSGSYISLTVDLLPAGITDDLSASGVLRIGGELFTFINRGSDQVTLTQRMQRRTLSSEHKIGELVQEVAIFSGTADAVIASLLLDYAGMNPAFIDTAAWAEEAALWSAALQVESWITEPTSVGQLVGEILQQTLCIIWWDEVAQQVRFKALRPRIYGFDDDPESIDDDANLISDGVSLVDMPDERLSRVRVYYDQINPTAGMSPQNFAGLKEKVDPDAESTVQYGEQRILDIYGRWLGSGASAGALAVAVRVLNRRRDTPKQITFTLDAKDRAIIEAAQFVSLTHHALVDMTGAPETRVIQITSVDEIEPGHRSQYEARIAENNINGYATIMADDAPDYGDATDEERLFGGWISKDDGTFDNGDPGYRLI